ncbi:hypothetical protein HN448_04415 [archaeon]|jgi:hypothetical protein|nr:hypothetical protein [archaeon]
MTKTESQFREWAKKEYPKAVIKKIPDFKQVGCSGAVGLPDYVIFHKGKTIWFEVKSGFGDTLNLKTHLTDWQRIVFSQVFQTGVEVNIYCFTKTKGRHIISYRDLLIYGKIKFK